MSYKHCTDCHAIFSESEAGEKPRTEWFEAWGHNSPHTFYDPCCPECGSEDIEEVETCACGKIGLKPGENVCENCTDDLSYIVEDLRKLYPNAKGVDKSTVLEVIADSW